MEQVESGSIFFAQLGSWLNSNTAPATVKRGLDLDKSDTSLLDFVIDAAEGYISGRDLPCNSLLPDPLPDEF